MNHNWSPLAEFDALPGNPDGVMDVVTAITRVQAVIEACEERLNSNSEDFWEGKAATVFFEQRGKLPDILGTLSARYLVARDQLTNWAIALESAQAQARHLVAEASDVEHQRQSLIAGAPECVKTNAINSQFRMAPTAGLEPLDEQAAQIDSLTASIDEFRMRFNKVVAELTSVANAAASAIREACDDDIRNQGGLLGFLENVVAPVLESLDGWLEALATIVAIAALFVPGLNILAFGLAAGVLLTKTAKYLDVDESRDERKGSGTDVVLAGLGVVTAGSASLGYLGKAASTANKATTSKSLLANSRTFAKLGTAKSQQTLKTVSAVSDAISDTIEIRTSGDLTSALISASGLAHNGATVYEHTAEAAEFFDKPIGLLKGIDSLTEQASEAIDGNLEIDYDSFNIDLLAPLPPSGPFPIAPVPGAFLNADTPKMPSVSALQR